MISRIRVKNFKCLRDTGNIYFKPLTFFLGANSSGKSSLIQSLVMLKQSLESTDRRPHLSSNGAWVDVGTYPEFIFKGDVKNNLEIEMDFELPKSSLLGTKFFREPNEEEVLVTSTLTFSFDKKTSQTVLASSNIYAEKLLGKEALLNLKDNEYRIKYWYMEDGKKQEGTAKKVLSTSIFNFIALNLRNKTAPLKQKKKPASSSEFSITNLFGFGIDIESKFRQLFYLGPLREAPRRFYSASGGSPWDTGTRGERALEIIWSEKKNKKSSKNLIDNVRKWFKKLGIAHDVRMTEISKGSYYVLEVYDKKRNTWVSIADTGFGASQILPVIVESFCPPKESTIVIEQPEIHLHPKGQTELGDLFIESVKSRNNSFIIETHSEHLLSRVRRRIAEGKISKDDVAIYYFSPSNNGTTVKELTLNEQGQYLKFPKGFFEEDLKETLHHLKSLQKKC